MSDTLTVVITTRDRPEHLVRAVCSVLGDESCPDVEVLVVDQSATDCSRKLLERRFAGCDRVRYVAMAGRGASAGRNLGIRMSQSELIAITDDDCVVPADWTASVLKLFAAHPDVDVLFGAVDAVSHDPRTSFVPSFTPRQPRIETSLADARDFHGMGANMALRRTAFGALGGFDERFGPGSLAGSAEDFELHYRALCGGCRVLIEPSLRVVHQNGRPMAQAWSLWRRDARGVGALAAHMLLLGHWTAAWRLWRGVVGGPGVQALGRLLHATFPTGLRCVATLALGFTMGMVHWLRAVEPADK